MYFLMNKDNMVAEISAEKTPFETEYSVRKIYGTMPYASDDIAKWLQARKASRHNRHIQEIMKACGCEKTEGYIRITHAATLNDTFWIKNENEGISWDQVSLYRNNFNESVSRLAFDGAGLYGLQMSGASPELTTGGNFRKCWAREDGEIILYKRGSEGARNAGLEPYCEALASEIAAKVCKNAVVYDAVTYHGKAASRCRLFTDERSGYLPYALVNGQKTGARDLLDFYSGIGSEDDFRRMLVLDALILNTDRHTNNHGVLVDNDTQDIIRMAPVYDFNLSMLHHCTEDDFQNIGKRVQELAPCIGDDFTELAKAVVTPEIRSDLVNLKGYSFSFGGDEIFPKWRVKKMEDIVDKHINAILGKSRVFTADVFPDIEDDIVKAMEAACRKAAGNPAVSRAEVIKHSVLPPKLNITLRTRGAEVTLSYGKGMSLSEVRVNGEKKDGIDDLAKGMLDAYIKVVSVNKLMEKCAREGVPGMENKDLKLNGRAVKHGQSR